jgi:2-oxoglutarate dehydrogenase E2 component (dihydrolipoamide succinyltransferase)
MVQVPPMAESISEGTLKQWSKRKRPPLQDPRRCLTATEVGDFVEQDEEIATIETDKVRLVQRICRRE